MDKYYPFLKFKQNEVQAIKELRWEVVNTIVPFFDVPRPDGAYGEEEIKKRVDLGVKQLKSLCKKYANISFFIDNFDLKDDVLINGAAQYEYILNQVASYGAMPVIAFDRNSDHNKSVYNFLKRADKKKVAIRFQEEDVESYSMIKQEIVDVYTELAALGVEEVVVVLDGRVLVDVDASSRNFSRFLNGFVSDFACSGIVSTGSIIPANFSSLIETGSEKNLLRREVEFRENIKASTGLEIAFGDYTVVSPEHSDVELEPELFRTISTPRVIYSFDNSFYIVRGVSFQSHPKGNGQYFDISDLIVGKSFFRGEPYSFGDKYIYDRSYQSAKKPGKAGSPGSWIKATVASHVTYIVLN